MDNVIQFRNVSFGYEEQWILKDVDLKIKKGDYTGIIGVNGVGKSTLLKLIMNQLKSDRGNIQILNQNIEKFNKWDQIGYINQKSNTFISSFPITVEEVVKMNLSSKVGLFKSIGKKYDKEINKALQTVGMEKYKKSLIGNLSGGQQQRVFIARAIVNSPSILLLDEPTVGIDINGQNELYKLLKELNEKLNLTIIIVSHDISIIKKEVKEIILVKDKNLKKYNKNTSIEEILKNLY